MQNYPTRREAEQLLNEAEMLNPGAWGVHSRVVGKMRRKIAALCDDMDMEKAYVLGLLHDIERRFGISHMKHVSDGYHYMLEMGDPDAARICLTHSFCVPRLDVYVGNADLSPQQQAQLSNALAALTFDEYDRLIQLCDAIGMASGATDRLTRMTDVKNRCDQYPEAKWNKNLELKAWFESKTGKTIEEITAGIVP